MEAWGAGEAQTDLITMLSAAAEYAVGEIAVLPTPVLDPSDIALLRLEADRLSSLGVEDAELAYRGCVILELFASPTPIPTLTSTSTLAALLDSDRAA